MKENKLNKTLTTSIIISLATIGLFTKSFEITDGLTVEQEIKNNSQEWNNIQRERDSLKIKDSELFRRQKALSKRNNQLRGDAEPIGKGLKIFMTSYNAEKWQTDTTPCIAGGTGINICDEEDKGVRVIALSQDLTSWSQLGEYRKRLNCGDGCITFDAGEKVILKQTQKDIEKNGINKRCEGEFIVGDAMNARYKKRGDLFFSNRGLNTSCEVKIFKTAI